MLPGEDGFACLVSQQLVGVAAGTLKLQSTTEFCTPQHPSKQDRRFGCAQRNSGKAGFEAECLDIVTSLACARATGTLGLFA